MEPSNFFDTTAHELFAQADVTQNALRGVIMNSEYVKPPLNQTVNSLLQHVFRFIEVTTENVMPETARDEYVALLNTMADELSTLTASAQDESCLLAANYAKQCITNQLNLIEQNNEKDTALVWFREDDARLNNVLNSIPANQLS